MRTEQTEPRRPEGILARLLHFEGPVDEFVPLLLAAQCEMARIEGGAIFALSRQNNACSILGVHPPTQTGNAPPLWLKAGVQTVQQSEPMRDTRMISHADSGLKGAADAQKLALVPLSVSAQLEQYACFNLGRPRREPLPLKLSCLELAGPLWNNYRADDLGQRGENEILRPVMEVLSEVNDKTRFLPAAMALCNELAARHDCDRVSVGFLSGRYVKLRAMSHTEKFSRKMDLVQAIESAMEECLDQDTEIGFPAPQQSMDITRNAAELSRRFGPSAVLSLPLRYEGEPVAVLTLQRPPEEPFTAGEITRLRLAANLASPRLIELHGRHRWFGARLATWLRGHLAGVLGPKHTWGKLAAVAGMAAVLFFCFARGTYKVSSSFVVRPVRQRVIAAPYDGFLQRVEVRPGHLVEAEQTLLARLKTEDLRSQLSAREAEQKSHLKEAAAAQRDGKIARAHIAEAKAEQAEAECELLRTRIGKAELRSPIAGVVLSGDHVRDVGGPVKLGDTLFEVAPLESLEAHLYVPEDDVPDVKEGQKGKLAIEGYPDRKVPFTVEKITPTARMRKQRNVFRVRARLDSIPPWMRPGMEGVAKVHVERRLLIHIWTRRLVNWVRMKLWW